MSGRSAADPSMLFGYTHNMGETDLPAYRDRNDMKRRYRIAGSLATLLITLVFAYYLIHVLRGRELTVYATPRAVAGIAVAMLLYCAGLPLISLAWRVLLGGVGTHKSWRELTAIMGITQFAKYLPGNVGQYVGRAAMSLARGIGIRAFGVTVVLEALLLIAAATTVGVGAVLLSKAGSELLHDRAEQLALLGIFLVTAITAIWLLAKFAPCVLRRFAPQHAHLLEGVTLPPRSDVMRACLLYVSMDCATGIGLIALAHLLLPTAAHDNALLIGSCALAWVIGFVTPGAPAGLGVREGLLLLMLGPVYGAGPASLLIIALRLATTLGDALWFAVGLRALPRSTSPAGVAPNG